MRQLNNKYQTFDGSSVIHSGLKLVLFACHACCGCAVWLKPAKGAITSLPYTQYDFNGVIFKVSGLCTLQSFTVLPRLGKRPLICLLSFACNYVVSVRRGFLFLWVLGIGCVILMWHSLGLPLFCENILIIIFLSAFKK